MKKFHRIISEVAQPSSEDELNFKEKHVIDHILDPNSEEDQFTADEIKKFYNRADYKKGEDMAVYEGVTLARRDLPGQEDDDTYNDGVQDMIDAQLRYRRHAQIKDKILGEGKMTPAQMKKREEIVLAMKKSLPDLKKKYGKDWENVMYAIATKQAMNEQADNSEWEQDCAKVKKSKDPKFVSKMIEKWGSRGGAWLNHPALNESLDPVGQEDDDINNDGKVDKSDAYLRARRRAIGKKLQQEGLTDVIEPVGGEYGDEEKSHVAYKKKNQAKPDHRGEPIEVRESRLDEVSRDLATRAARAFSDKADKAHDKKDYVGYKKGEAARKMAVNKVTGRAKVPAVPRNVPLPKAVEEEVEQIHEVSKATLGRYIKAAGPDRERLTKRAKETSQLGHEYKKDGDAKKAQELFYKAGGDVLKAANRRSGINKAVDKLAKEDVSLANPKAGMRVYAGKTKKSQVAEAFEEGTFYFDDGSTAALFYEEAEVLNNLFEKLDESNRQKMLAIATSCESGLNEIVRFARETL